MPKETCEVAHFFDIVRQNDPLSMIPGHCVRIVSTKLQVFRYLARSPEAGHPGQTLQQQVDDLQAVTQVPLLY